MFRLANLSFEDVPELEKLATFCITETIKMHLEDFFEKDYDKCSCGDLFNKVKIEKAKGIFPEKLLDEIESLGVNNSPPKSKKTWTGLPFREYRFENAFSFVRQSRISSPVTVSVKEEGYRKST